MRLLHQARPTTSGVFPCPSGHQYNTISRFFVKQ
nr:MAG TPA: hypothetical protein [Caudoviricetes sp.]